MTAMFAYDSQLAGATQTTPQTIHGVLQLMETIQNTCVDGDGLKWFNWLYFQVTQAVADRVATGGFHDPAWLSALDVQFAALYFGAIHGALSGAACPGCWNALFVGRNRTRLARIQFALAGMNAHINHDLPMAIISTCRATRTVPQHGTAQYNDYTALNVTLDSLVDRAKQTLNVRLPGDAMPAVSFLENTIAAWDLAAAREHAWNTSQVLWQEPACGATVQMDVIDGLTTVISKTLLVTVP
jgi:hypothetical protein